MITYQPTDTAEAQQDPAPVTRVYGHPLEQVARVDALDCQDTATYRIGDRLVCDYHRLEVAHALWEADARQPMFDVEASLGHRCGETFPEVSR
jgi:hypothetical protein